MSAMASSCLSAAAKAVARDALGSRQPNNISSRVRSRAGNLQPRDRRPVLTRATATAGRLSGFSGPRISSTKPNSQATVGKTLNKVKPGDLLALTLTAGDGSGHLASGEDLNQVTWMVATKLSTSTGGHLCVEGELNGLRVQVIDQGARGGARLGIVGLLIEPNQKGWIDSFPGWKAHLAKREELETSVMNSVVDIKICMSLDKIERCVVSNPSLWCGGSDSPNRRSVITDPIERATQTAGEILALLNGERCVVMCQLWAGWSSMDAQPVEAPFVIQLLRRAIESGEVGVAMSESDDVEGNPGLTAVLYSRKDGQESAGDGEARKKRVRTWRAKDCARWAHKIAELGAQADCPAVTPYECALVGMALGYDERDVAYHLQGLGWPFSAHVFERAREVLDGVGPADAKIGGAEKDGKKGGLMNGLFGASK